MSGKEYVFEGWAEGLGLLVILSGLVNLLSNWVIPNWFILLGWSVVSLNGIGLAVYVYLWRNSKYFIIGPWIQHVCVMQIAANVWTATLNFVKGDSIFLGNPIRWQTCPIRSYC
jgi:hypothetical protein